jgi:hypothetical protein
VASDHNRLTINLNIVSEPTGSTSLDKLEWAFAGVSSSEQRTDENGNQISHSIWRHWVDSRIRDAESVVDEGDMVTLPDGTTLETGRMVNPATGVETDYEEVWEAAEALPGMDMAAPDPSPGVFCAVVQLDDAASGRRGMAIRLGQFCQGIVVGDEVTVERWEWTEEGGWQTTFSVGPEVEELRFVIGQLASPSRGEDYRQGLKMMVGEVDWEVVEFMY